MLVLGLSFACQRPAPEAPADLLLLNGNFYTVNPEQPRAEALAVRDGKIVAVGDAASVDRYRGADTRVIDLEGAFAMPGFIEGHGHFAGLGASLINLNFLGVKSWDEVVQMVAERVAEMQPGEWITGRGWHQEKWTETPNPQVLGYPYHYALSAVSPDNPVVLRHASGHSLFANAKAMELAGITSETPDPSGGEVVRDAEGKAVGVFEETAMHLIMDVYQDYLATLPPEQRKAQWLEGNEVAQEACLAKGVTSFQDAGTSLQEIEWYRELAAAGELDLRLWVMVRQPYDVMKGQLQDFPVIGEGGQFFTCRAIKSAVDGALGAFGAWLLEPYEDKAGFYGQNTVQLTEVRNIARLARERGMQMCVHAIGDRANREVLDIFAEAMGASSEAEDLRWRIEHAQHLDTADIPRFAEMGVIASMQGIHCTSDAPFVVKRLGEERARYGAYPWRSLLDAGAVVTNGTDAPVEEVDPIPCFYASVTRKRADSGLSFFPEQAMTRAEAVHSYTLANAYAAFEESSKGSLEAGKLADIVVLSNDLLTCSEAEILQTEVLMTMVGGQVKYRKTEED